MVSDWRTTHILSTWGLHCIVHFLILDIRFDIFTAVLCGILLCIYLQQSSSVHVQIKPVDISPTFAAYNHTHRYIETYNYTQDKSILQLHIYRGRITALYELEIVL